MVHPLTLRKVPDAAAVSAWVTAAPPVWPPQHQWPHYPSGSRAVLLEDRWPQCGSLHTLPAKALRAGLEESFGRFQIPRRDRGRLRAGDLVPHGRA